MTDLVIRGHSSLREENPVLLLYKYGITCLNFGTLKIIFHLGQIVDVPVHTIGCNPVKLWGL